MDVGTWYRMMVEAEPDITESVRRARRLLAEGQIEAIQNPGAYPELQRFFEPHPWVGERVVRNDID